MTQIYANVRPESKYSRQATAEPFKVTLSPGGDGYHWKGGIGGQYRTSDLCFFIKRDETLYPFELYDPSNTPELLLAKNAIEDSAKQGYHSSYWERVVSLTSEMGKIARKALKTQHQREEEERQEEESNWY